MIVTVLQDVTALLTPAPAPAFYHAEQFEQNTQDDAVLPLVYLEHPIKGKDVMPQGMPARTNLIAYTVNLFFLDRSELADTIVERQVIIDAMYALKRQFVVRLSNDERVKSVDAVETMEVYNVLDANLDGIWVTLSLTLYDGGGLCLN